MPPTAWSALITELETITHEVSRENFKGGPQTALSISAEGICIVVEQGDKRHSWTMPWHWLRTGHTSGPHMIRRAIEKTQTEFRTGGVIIR